MQIPTRALTILSLLLYNTILSSSSLFSLYPNHNTASILRQLVKEKKIKAHTYRYKTGIKNRAGTYYTLTDTGFYYLLDYPSFLPFPIRSTSFPYRYLPYFIPGKTVSNVLHEVSANIFFSTLPSCTTFPIFFGANSNTGENIAEIKGKSEEQETDDFTEEMEYELPSESDADKKSDKTPISSLLEPVELSLISSPLLTEYCFTPTSVFRHEAQRNLNTTTFRELCYSQFSGIFSSDSRSYLIYTGTSAGMSWNRKILDAEKKTLSLYNFLHKLPDDSPSCGILLLKTPRDLISIYNDSAKRRIASKDLNHSLYALYTVPMIEEGRYQIEHLMKNDIRAYKNEFINNLLSSPYYIRNPDKSSPFPLLHTSDQFPCYYGFDMDLISLKNLPQNTPFLILCRPYQVPYYSAIFPDYPIKAFS